MWLTVGEQSMRSGATTRAHAPASTNRSGIAFGHGRVRSAGASAIASAMNPSPQIATEIEKIQGCAAPFRPSSLMYCRSGE